MNFGGYEIVREVSRSPLGLSATARGPDGGPEAYFVQVQYFDPIASRGEERYVVEAFLERARIQRLVEGGHWATIHAVGEIGEGAFAVSELFPRTAQALIDGRTRLASVDIQRVMLGAIDALAELRERAEGRAHGALKAESVLIDDSAGSARWRVALCDPSPERWKVEELAAAKLRDARALGAVAIGLVEHRQPRTLPTRIEVSEPWKRVGGAQAEAWVAAVNRLLHADLDPATDWLAAARADFAAIRVVGRKRNRAPLIAAGVLALALAGGVGWFILGRGGEKVVEPILVSDLTPEAWQDWIEASDWVGKLARRIEEITPEERNSMSPAAREFLDGIVEEIPVKDLNSRVWNPHLHLELGSLEDLLVDGVASDEQRLQLLAKVPDAATMANTVAVRASQIRERCASPPARDDLVALVETLGGWGAAEGQLQGLQAAADALTPGEIRSAEQVVALVQAVDAATRAGETRAALEALDGRLAEIRLRAGEAGAQDPILSRLDALTRGGVLASLDEGGDSQDAYRSLASAAAEATRVLDALAAFVAEGYERVETAELTELLAERGTADKTGFAAITEWLDLARDERVTRLSEGEDPLAELRGGDGVGAFVRGATDRLAEVEGLPQRETEPRIQSALPEMRAELAAIESTAAEALGLPPTLSNRDELERRRASLTERRDALGGRALTLFNEFSRTLDELVADITQDPFEGDPDLSAALDAERERVLGLADEARALPPQEQNQRAAALFDEYTAEVERLGAIAAHTARTLDLRGNQGGAWTPVIQAFEARRREVKRDLAAAGGAIPTGSHAGLDALAAEVAAAAAAAAELEANLDRWALPPVDSAAVVSPALSGDAAMAEAFAEAVSALRARVHAVAGLGGAPGELLNIAGDADAHRELRRAAFERAGEGAWPASGGDLRAVLDAQRAIVAALGSTEGPLWSVEEVEGIGATRWASAMGNAPTEAAFIEVRGMREEFGLPAAAEDALADSIRRSAAVVDLKASVGAFEPGDDPEADDRAVGGIVTAWLAEHGDLFAGDAAWTASLREALAVEAAGGGDFEAGNYGPGTQGWSGRADENLEVLTYVRGGRTMSFRRIETGEGGDVWFLAVEEVSLGLFLEVAGGSIGEDDNGFADLGPRGWIYDDSASPAGTWFDHKERGSDLLEHALFAPGLSVAGAEAELESERDEQKDQSKDSLPVQHITLEAAEEFNNAIGCVFPSVEAWQAAAAATFAQAGAGSVGVSGQAATALGLQLRDATWRVQFDYSQGLANRTPSHDWWSQGGFAWGAGAAAIGGVWNGVDDGLLYFAPVAGRTGVLWTHIVGNVGEIVQALGGIAVIGASAMSPPSVEPGEPVAINRRALPAADIGIRPAFTVPARALNPTVARKVERVLEGSPARFPAAGAP